MARKKSAVQQSSLFKREIPQMPEGYYSSGPNPNLRRFVEEHASPFAPEHDQYEREPFAEALVDESDTTVYNMHPYWSKKPHGAIAEYVSHYTEAGDLILDPFAGSGGTNSVATQLGRPSIGIDISSAAIFIAKHLCTPYPIEDIEAAYDEMIVALKPVRDWLYGTKCHRCDGSAETQYLVWSQTYRCTKCFEIVPYYKCKGRKCPNCGERISTSQERYGYVPVLANVKCLEGCRPARVDRAIDSKNPDNVAAFKNLDLAKLAEIDNAQIPYWYPTDPFPTEWVSWRPNLGEIENVSGFFTKRNLWAVASIVDWINQHQDVEATSWLMLSLTGSIMSVSKKAQHLKGGGGYIPGNYVFPPQIKERNVFNSYKTLFRKAVRGVETLNQRIKTTSVLLSTQSALDLHAIPDNSIDYIFTDPPYSDKVPFGEFNFLWEVWLRSGVSWDKDEILVNPKLEKGLAEWKQMLKRAAEEMYRVLKPGRWISVCYHDSSEGSWMHLQDVFAEVGFISEEAEKVLSIERTRKSWKQATTSKVQKRDLVINFRKPRPGELIAQLALFGDEDAATFAEKARTILCEALEAHPGSPADRLYDELVSRMVRKGEFERHNFDELLHSVAEEVDGRWYLLETADQVDEAESAKEAAAAAHLEAFMQTYLAEHLEESGVHYSDLFEQYLPVQDKPRRLMQDWLPEYFFRTPEGTWRPPSNEEERAQKETLRTSGTLRRIKRFARALLEGVPPHDRDRPANTATAADWVRQCRRAGLYDLGRALYEKGGFNFEELGDEGQLEVEEDYQVCVRRSG
jgi:hypothetical protein